MASCPPSARSLSRTTLFKASCATRNKHVSSEEGVPLPSDWKPSARTVHAMEQKRDGRQQDCHGDLQELGHLLAPSKLPIVQRAVDP
jgi:hypothetical protein